MSASEEDFAAGQPHERMSVRSASALVAASMIGAGVYTTSGYSLASLQSPTWVVIAWAIGGTIAICGAICYGALAKQFTESGGEYLFLKRAVHPAAGMTAGWVSLLAGFTGAIAFAATAFESYARGFDMPELEGLPPNSMAISLVVVASLVHSLGLRKGTRFQDLWVLIKLTLIALFLLVSYATIFQWQGGNPEVSVDSEPMSDWQFTLALANALTWISLSYSGFNASVYLASEIESPESGVPRSMFQATLLVTVIYLLLNIVFVFAPPYSAVVGQGEVATLAAQSVGAQLAELKMPGAGWVENLVRLAILFGLMTSVSALVQSGPRVFKKMTQDGFLPAWICSESQRQPSSVPITAIWIQACLAATVICVATLRQQLDYLGFTLSVCAAACGSLVFFYRNHPQYPIRVGGYPVIPLIYVGGTFVIATLTAIRAPIQAAIGVLTLVLGAGLYGIMKPAGTDQANSSAGEDAADS